MQEEWYFEHSDAAAPPLRLDTAGLQFLKIYFNLQDAIMLYCGSLVQKQGFFLFYFVFSPESRCHREPGSLVLRVSAKMFIPFNSWVRVFCLLFEIPTAWQLEVKRVATAVKAGCLLMSRPAEWMRTQMGFLSGGLFFWPSLSVVGDMGTSARIGRHLIEWGKT